MAANLVNIGTGPNNGDGDPIRVAMSKINDNFAQVYSTHTLSNSISIGANLVINTSAITAGNSTINLYASATSLKIANSIANVGINNFSISVGANVTVNTSGFYVGNVATNTTAISVTTASGNIVLTGNVITIGANVKANASVLFIGNSSVNTVVNSTAVLISNGGTTVVNSTTVSSSKLINSSNTFQLGSSSLTGANGYTYLANGLKLNYGWVSTNSSVGAVTFADAYTTNALTVIVTSNTATSTYQAGVTGWTAFGATVRTANATSTNVYYMAIGV